MDEPQLPQEIPSIPGLPPTTKKAKFRKLAQQWKSETGHFSVVGKRYKHPAYKAIIDIGSAAVPLILEEMRREPDRWFDALERITKTNPAANSKTFYEAIDDWISWGAAHQLIA